MPRNYQREERDWRRQGPYWQEEDNFSGSRSDENYIHNAQEGRGSRGEDYSRRGGQETTGRWQNREDMRNTSGQNQGFSERDSREGNRGDHRRAEPDWGQSGESWQSPWQRSQRRGSEGEFGGAQYGGTRSAWSSWNEPYEGKGGPGWYEGMEDAMHRGQGQRWNQGQGQFAGKGPRNYKRGDDRIEEEINERLTRHGSIDATDVEVSVQNGEVTLRGTVDSRQAKRLTEDIADSVSGVKEVINQIRIKQRGESGSGTESPSRETESTGKPQQRKTG